MNSAYPTMYSNASHKYLLSLDVSQKAIILFISSDHVKHGFDGLIKLLAHVRTAKEYLIIYAEDIPYEWTLQTKDSFKYEPPTEQQFLQIDNFLKENANLEVIASCGAGTSRSGFVHWYLDVIQNNISEIIYNQERDLYIKGENPFNENTYRANSLLVHFAKKHLSTDQKLIVSKIANKK